MGQGLEAPIGDQGLEIGIAAGPGRVLALAADQMTTLIGLLCRSGKAFGHGQAAAQRQGQRAVLAFAPQGHQCTQPCQRFGRVHGQDLHQAVARHHAQLGLRAAGGQHQAAQVDRHELVGMGPALGIEQVARVQQQPALCVVRLGGLFGFAGLAQPVDPVVEHQAIVLDQQPPARRGMGIPIQLLAPGPQRRRDRGLQRPRAALAQPRQRQPPRAREARHGRTHAVFHGLGRLPGLGQAGRHLLLQLLHQQVFGQAVELEQLLVHDRVVLLLEAHLQALAQVGARRVAQEIGEPGQRQRRRGVGDKGRARLRGQRRQRVRAVRLRMRGPPFARIGGPGRAFFEIAAAEGLQRVLLRALRQQRLAAFAAPAGLQVVAQLGDQDRGRLLAVVAHMVAGPADVERAARGQQGFEHELAVIVAARAVAGALLAGQRHQVEVAARGAARIVAIVHAQQADHLEGNGAHGHQRAKGHATGPKALRQRGLLQRLHPGLLGHAQFHGLRIAGLLAGALPVREGGVQCGQHGLVLIVLRLEEVLQQRAKALRPGLGHGGLLGLAPPRQHALQQRGQHAGQLGRQAAHFVIGLDAAEGLAVLRHAAGIAQQHALQAEPGAVVLAAGLQAQGAALRRIESPADAGPGHPARELGQVVGRQTHARGNRWDVQQVAQLAEPAALLRQAQQPLQGHGQRAAGACAQVGNVKGNVARIMPAVLAEHGAYRGRGGLYGRQHDYDVTRCQRCLPRLPGIRWPGQHLQQLIVQNLQLAHHAVRAVEHDGAVGPRHLQRRVLGQRHQVADALLHLGQQRRGAQVLGIGFVEQVHARHLQLGCGTRGVEGVELAHIVAALPAPGGQQRMGVGMHGLQRQLRQVAAAAQRLAAPRHAQQLAPVDGVGPMEAAGIGHGQQHLAVAGNGGQELQQAQR